MAQHSREVVFPLNKMRLGMALLLAAIFVAFGIRLLRGGASNPIGVVLIMVLFGSAGLIFLFRILDSNPGLVVDEKGFTDNTTLLPFGRVEWSEVTGFEARWFYVAVFVEDMDALLSRLARPRATMARIFLLGGDSVNISTGLLPIGTTKLAKLLGEFHERAGASRRKAMKT